MRVGKGGMKRMKRISLREIKTVYKHNLALS